MSSIRSLSVSSTSRLPGSKPVLSSALPTLVARSPPSAWRGETLTLTGDRLAVQGGQPLPEPAGLADREALDLGDQAGVLGQRHEVERWHEVPGAPPAQQRLDTGQPAVGEIDDRLQQHLDLVLLDRPVQRADHLDAARGLLAQARVEERQPPPPALLGRVHGDVRVADQLARRRGVATGQRDADAAADVDLAARDRERLGQRGEHAPRHDLGARGAAVGQVGGELVATEARQDVALAQGALQPPGGLAQQRVARLVAVAVVDELEAVDVDEEHGGGATATLRELALELAGELAAIDESRERIVLSGVRELGLGALALGHVGEDALEAGSAAVVDDPASLVAHPDDAPVRMQEAVLVVEETRRLGVALVAHDTRAVVGVDPLQPQLGIGHPLLRAEPQHRLDLRAHVETAPGRARLPAVGRHRHALEQRAEALFGELLVGVVIHAVSGARRVARLESYRHAGARR